MMTQNYISRLQRPPALDYNNPDTLRLLVPSVFEVSLSEKVSDKYRPIPTIKILEALWGEGWMVTKAQQSRTKMDTHAKHMLRLRHKTTQPILNGVHPEIVLINSHDGTSSYQLRGGIYRLVCTNGMVTGSDTFLEKVRHMGSDIPRLVAEGANRLLSQLPIIGEKVIELTQTAMSELGSKVFAISAIDARMDNPLIEDEKMAEVEKAEKTGFYRGFDIKRLVAPIRQEDQPKTLWNALNVLQEKLLRKYQSHASGRPIQLSPTARRGLPGRKENL